VGEMMMVMPSNPSSIATCLQQKPMGNGITDSCREKNYMHYYYEFEETPFLQKCVFKKSVS
jgi:hypothetical protein